MLSITYKETNEKNEEMKVLNMREEKMRDISLPLDFKAQFAKLGREKKKHFKTTFGAAHKTSAKLLSK